MSEITPEITPESETILLKSSDGEEFQVEKKVMLESSTIKHMIEDDCAQSVIPLPNVTGKILSKVIEYCRKHVEFNAKRVGIEKPLIDVGDSKDEADMKTWDAEFIKVDQDVLFDLILAANYLDIKELLDFLCHTVADMMKGKTPEEIRKTFHIVNDYTPEEEEEVRKENAWAFE